MYFSTFRLIRLRTSTELLFCSELNSQSPVSQFVHLVLISYYDQSAL